jgi:hypothetical protein
MTANNFTGYANVDHKAVQHMYFGKLFPRSICKVKI